MCQRIPWLRLLVSATAAGWAALFLLLGSAQAATGTIARVAGTGSPGFSGDGGPAASAQLAAPIAILPTSAGGYYIADQGNSRIRYVGADGQITTVAGSGVEGFGGDGGPATAAEFDGPSALAALPDGSLLVADANNNRIRKISGGNVTTVAGTGAQGSSGDGGSATAAELRFPFDIAVAGDGSFYIADTDNNKIRKVSATGIITTFAGTGTPGFSGDGGPATAAQLDSPEGVAIAPDGSLLIADRLNQRIRRVALDGTISTVAGNGTAGASGDGGPPLSAELNVPSRVTSLPDGGFLVADVHNNEIRRVDGGTITTVAGDGTAGATGDGGQATAAELDQPAAAALTADNDYLIADTANQEVRRVDAGDATPAPSPPAPPPPPAPEANLTPPRILHLSSSHTDPYYTCHGATWVGLAANPNFTYTWYHELSVPRFGGFGGAPQTILVKVFTASLNLYKLPDNLRGGQFVCRIDARSASGKTLSASSGIQTLTGLERSPLDVPKLYGNFRIDGIDVFQTVQPNANDQKFAFPPGYQGMCGGGTPTSWYPDSDPGLGCSLAHLASPGAQQANYVGVRLDPDKAATAVVYVDSASAVSDAGLPLTVTLHGVAGGRQLPGFLVQTIKNPPVSSTQWVTSNERTSGKGRVLFTLPADWLAAARTPSGGSLDLVATVALPASATATYECNTNVLLDATNCVGDDTFRLNSVSVSPSLPPLIIRTVELPDGAEPMPSPDQVLRDVTGLYPGGELITVDPYLTQIDITKAAGLTHGDDGCPTKEDVRSCREAAVDADVTQWLSSVEFVGRKADMFLAVHDYQTGDGGLEPGWSNGLVLGNPNVRMMVNDGSAGRPLTAAAHEFGHALGAPHADLNCGGNSNGQVGESWAPDDKGRLEATEFGPYDSNGNRTQTVVTDTGTGSGQLFDLMSYCASESNAWISPFNWERFIGTLVAYEHPKAAHALARRDAAVAAGVNVERAAQSAAATSASVSGQAYVIGTLSSSGGSIDRVVPADPGNHVPVSQPGSVVDVTAYAPSGAPLSHVGAAVERLSNADQPLVTFTAPLPAGTASVTAAVNGQVVARAVRSRPPRVRLLAPRVRTRVGGSARARLRVRWRASDPDHDALQVTVDYRPGGGAWTPVYMGPDHGHASIPGSLLSGSPDGRIRVTVNDGFNRARAISALIRAAGQPPHVHISAPVARQRLQAGSSVLLVASATDDRDTRLLGRHLTWFAGRRVLGHGSLLRVTLPAGRIVVRLTARDSRGHATSVARTIRVIPVPLQLTRLSAPSFVPSGTKTLRLSVDTTTAATLRAAGRRYAVGPKVRTLSIRLPKLPAHGQFAVGLVVTARGIHQRPIRARVVVIRG